MAKQITPDDVTDDQSHTPTYEGDYGDIPIEVRRVVVTLMRGPYVWRSERKAIWETMIRYQDCVKKALSNVFLDLIVDEAEGVAYVKQADTAGIDAPSLLNSYRFRFLDSVILIRMRELLLHASPLNERAVISDEEIGNLLRLFDPSSKKDELMLSRKKSAIVNRFIDRHLLLELPEIGSYEISPVLKLIFDIGEIQALKDLYEQKKQSQRKVAHLIGDDEGVFE